MAWIKFGFKADSNPVLKLDCKLRFKIFFCDEACELLKRQRVTIAVALAHVLRAELVNEENNRVGGGGRR